MGDMRGDGGEGEFEQLCRDQYAHVVRTAYLITGDREEAVDLAQEAFARAFERWRTVSRLSSPEAWIQRVGANLAISLLRRRRLLTRLPVPRPSGPVPEPPLADPELLRALRSLSPAQRNVLVLRFYADWSVDEVAHVLRKRPGTVRALTSQGLARLREFLPREVDDETRG